MTRGSILDALHGAPGDHKKLTIDRDGQTIDVDTTVTDYSTWQPSW